MRSKGRDLKGQERHKRLRRILHARWREQGGLCIWCGEWTWLNKHYTELDAAVEIEMKTGARPTVQAVKDRMATVEHFTPLSLKGCDEPINILCACLACNHKRGTRTKGLRPSITAAVGLPKQIKKRVLALV